MSEREDGRRRDEWKRRVLGKLGSGACAGGFTGLLIANARGMPVPKVTFNMSLNFAIFAGLCGTLQELVRLSPYSIIGGAEGNEYKHKHEEQQEKKEKEITVLNTFVSGSLAGGFLCGVNRGPRSIVPGALVFGSAVGLMHSLDDHFQFYDMCKNTLVSMDLLDMDGEEKEKLKKSQAWDLGKYWPSSIPAPIRIHTPEEVAQLAELRKKKLEEKLNPHGGEEEKGGNER